VHQTLKIRGKERERKRGKKLGRKNNEKVSKKNFSSWNP